MNENIGSKGKGNDYRRVLKNIERKKDETTEQAKKNRPKKKRVVQITDSIILSNRILRKREELFWFLLRLLK